VKEFVDFLGVQSPYDALDPPELERLARSVEVEFFTRGATVVDRGGAPLDHVWVVRSGAVEVLDDDRLVDLLGVGDTFGHVSTLSGTPPALTVRAAEDTLCYRLPDPRTVLDHPDRLRYAAYGTQLGRRQQAELQARGVGAGGGLGNRAGLPVGRCARPVVQVAPGTPIREVARLIGEARSSCAVVTFPDDVGIVTDADFRRVVATGEAGPDDPVHRIANRPVLGVGEDVVVAQAFAEMLEHGVHHLVVRDGSGRPTGVVRAVDLSSAELRDPLVVRAAVEAASTLAELTDACRMLPRTTVELYEAGVPAARLAALQAAVLDAVLRRLLDLDRHVADAGARVSWLVLGSLARREVLPGSDVDTAIVWTAPDADQDADPDAARDAEPGADPGPSELDARVLGAAHRVLQDLQRTGLEICSEGANADNPRFARSLPQWRAATDRWLHNPNSTQDAFLLSTMLADSRALTEPDLGRRVTDGLLRASRSPQFMRMLLQYSLSSRPPTGFVRTFVVEHSGEHRGQLNLKRGGLRPVTSLGRWIAVATGDPSGTTETRLRRGVEARLLTRDEADTLIAAHEQIFALLLEREIDAVRAGVRADTYLAPDSLDSLTRRHLRESFRAIAHVQNRLESVWTNRAGG